MMMNQDNDRNTPRKLLPNSPATGEDIDSSCGSSESFSEYDDTEIMKSFIINHQVHRTLLREDIFRYLVIGENSSISSCSDKSN